MSILKNSFIALSILMLTAMAHGQNASAPASNLHPGKKTVWTTTSPTGQIALSIGDVVAVGALQLLQNPKFLQVSGAYDDELAKEKRLTKKFLADRSVENQSALYEQEKATQRAYKVLDKVSARSRVKLLKTIRFVGSAVFMLDLTTRAVQYFTIKEDPGWFPFMRLFQINEPAPSNGSRPDDPGDD